MMRITAKDLGAVCDGIADDGAILSAAIASQFGTLATGPRQTPVEIDMGDLTYNLDSTLNIVQNHIKLIGNPCYQCNNISPAIRVHLSGTANNIYGVQIVGTLLGTVSGDAVVVEAASQCVVNIVNKANVLGAVSLAKGCYSCSFEVHADAEGGSSCSYGHRETPLLQGSAYFISHNSRIDAVVYEASQSAVRLEESQGFSVYGDYEKCSGPAVDLYNCQLGLVSIYTEKNGLGATGVGTSLPSDVRIDSGSGHITTSSDSNIVALCRFGGEPVTIGGSPVTPVNIHVIDATQTHIASNIVGGRIRLQENAEYTHVGKQARLLNALENLGSYTSDHSVPGKITEYASIYERLTINALDPAGPIIKGGDSVKLRVANIAGFSTGSTLPANFAFSTTINHGDVGSDNTVTFNLPNAELDANYIPVLGMWLTDGSAATRSIWLLSRNATSITMGMDAKPGSGKSFNVNVMMLRTG